MEFDFEKVHALYVSKYPSLGYIRYGNWRKNFADNALRLVPPTGVTAYDLWCLSKFCKGAG